jgi:crotonobetainyl-CoA:carnitine CoA-transferase CaiB-like acyl-CoA transferase
MPNDETKSLAGTTGGALAGIKVLDLSRVLAGPFSAQMLADLGADVIKIERPGTGDDSRTWTPPTMRDDAGRFSGESTYFHAANRGKRSITVDLASAQGQEIVRRLALNADVLIENYKVDTLERYNLGYQALSALNPRLVYCSITGFGQSGPYRARPGYDTIVQAMGGLMSITGEPGQDPQRVGVAVTDIMTGLYAAIGILSALNHRHTSGKGQYIDLALLDVQLTALANIGMNYLATGEIPQRCGNINPTVQPSGVFRCSDGFVMIICGNNRQFQSICEAAGRPELPSDPRFALNAGRVAHMKELHAMLNESMAGRPTAHWLAVLERADIPAGPINDIAQAFGDPHVRARGTVVNLSHPTLGKVPTIANPLRMSGTPIYLDRAPPLLSQHTREVLGTELGLSDQELSALEAKNII